MSLFQECPSLERSSIQGNYDIIVLQEWKKWAWHFRSHASYCCSTLGEWSPGHGVWLCDSTEEERKGERVGGRKGEKGRRENEQKTRNFTIRVSNLRAYIYCTYFIGCVVSTMWW